MASTKKNKFKVVVFITLTVIVISSSKLKKRICKSSKAQFGDQLMHGPPLTTIQV